MASDPQTERHPASDRTCIDCGAPVEEPLGGVPICDNCLTTRGSCCPEFGAFDLTEDDAPGAYASPPCSAHLFEEADGVRHDPTEKRFETPSGARLDYRLDGRTMDITHTFVPEHLRGKGLASELMKAAIQYAKHERLDLHASCSYAQTYLKRKGIL